MKKKIAVGLTILFMTVVMAFAATYAEQIQAKSAGYDWGYSNPDEYCVNNTAERRGYKGAELICCFRDGAKIGQADKKAGKDYNNPFNNSCY